MLIKGSGQKLKNCTEKTGILWEAHGNTFAGNSKPHNEFRVCSFFCYFILLLLDLHKRAHILPFLLLSVTQKFKEQVWTQIGKCLGWGGAGKVIQSMYLTNHLQVRNENQLIF